MREMLGLKDTPTEDAQHPEKTAYIGRSSLPSMDLADFYG